MKQTIAFLIALLALSLGGCQLFSAKSKAGRAHDTKWSPADPSIGLSAQDEQKDGASAASYCPADVDLFVQINNLKQLRAEADEDPMVQFAMDQLPGFKWPQWWFNVQEKLNMDAPTVIDTYFGRSVVVIGRKVKKRIVTMVFTRVEPKWTDDIATKLAWNPAPASGAFKTWTGGNVLIAIKPGWMMFCEKRYAETVYETLPQFGTEQNLACDEQFVKALDLLPTKQGIIVFARNSKKSEVHSAVAAKDQRNMTIHYVGQIPKFPDLFNKFRDTQGVDFGPLPDTTVSATTVNVFDRDPKYTELINLMLFPRDYRRDIMPKLAAPIVLFMGQVPSEQLDPSPGVAVPVFGMAIRMKDPTVAPDLDRMMNAVRVMANISELQLLKTVFGNKSEEQGENRFHTADFGKAISNRVKDEKLSKLVRLPGAAGLMKISYGPIGNWYVVCSQQAFFAQCIMANADPDQRLTAIDGFDSFGLAPQKDLLLSSVLRADQLSYLIEQAAEYWEKHKPLGEVEKTKESDKPINVEDLDKPMRWFSGIVGHHNSFSVQLWRHEDDTLRGRFRVVRDR